MIPIVIGCFHTLNPSQPLAVSPHLIACIGFKHCDPTENNTSFGTFKLASKPLELVQSKEHEKKGIDLLTGESKQEHGGLILLKATVKLHHWLLTPGHGYPWSVLSATGYAGWII